jgi:recombination protein RecR
MKLSPSIQTLVDALRQLPGIGPKSAQRMTLHLLERDRETAASLASALSVALEKVQRCDRCRNFTELRICEVCGDPKRDESLLCVVEAPADVLAIEQTASYRGLYYVLMGHLSPLDGVGPEQLGLDRLSQLLSDEPIEEVILATNPTMEGEATGHYIAQLARQESIKVSRIAHGVPLGGELEYIDTSTLAHALGGRRTLSD